MVFYKAFYAEALYYATRYISYRILSYSGMAHFFIHSDSRISAAVTLSPGLYANIDRNSDRNIVSKSHNSSSPPGVVCLSTSGCGFSDGLFTSSSPNSALLREKPSPSLRRRTPWPFSQKK